jgi:hypothetical protein
MTRGLGPPRLVSPLFWITACTAIAGVSKSISADPKKSPAFSHHFTLDNVPTSSKKARILGSSISLGKFFTIT